MPAPLDFRAPPPPPPEGTARAASPVLSWEAPEYVLREKGPAWYGAVGVAVAVLVFLSFLLRSFLSGVVFVLLGVLVLLVSNRPPRTVRFQITPEALFINDRRFPFRDLEAFNVVASVHGPLALVRGRRLSSPLLHLPLGTQDPEAVRSALRRGLREDVELHESLADVLAHRFGF